MSTPEAVSVCREMQISECSGLDHTLTPGVGLTDMMGTVQWVGSPKENHGAISRTREKGGWVHSFEAHLILVSLSLHSAILLFPCGVKLREQNLISHVWYQL